MLPTCIIDLIVSFLPGPEPYEPYEPPFLVQLDTMQISDWTDTCASCLAYGDY
jgi:hypothetical protein